MSQLISKKPFEFVTTYPVHDRRAWFVEISVPYDDSESIEYRTEFELTENELRKIFREEKLCTQLAWGGYDFENQELNDYLINKLILKILTED